LIGKNVLAPGSTLTVSSGTASGFGVQVGGATSDLTATIKNSSGQTVQTLDLGAQKAAGVVPVAWNGESSSGTVVPDGTYTISVAAASTPATATASAATVTATPLSIGTVTSVVQQSSGVGLTLSNGNTVALSSVADIL